MIIVMILIIIIFDNREMLKPTFSTAAPMTKCAVVRMRSAQEKRKVK